MVYIIASISFFVGFLFLLKIRSYDKYEPEPLWQLIKFTLLGGIVSVVTASIIYEFVYPQRTFIDAIFRVGTVEEGAKLITIFLLYKIVRKDFDEIVDGIIYIAAIALGFSVLENIMYAMKSVNPYSTLALRFFTATIGHISFSVYLGIAFYIHKKVHKNYFGLFLAFILSTLAHGFYDGFIFDTRLTFLFFPAFIFFIYLQFRLLKVAYAYSKMKKNIPFFFDKKDAKFKHDTYCCNCETSQTNGYLFNNHLIEVCDTCENVIIEQDSFDNLLKYFRPKLNRKQFFNSFIFIGRHYLNVEETIKYSNQKQRLNANQIDFINWLKEENNKDLLNYHRTIEGKIFNLLGFRFL